jgi:hypothetical protein
MSNLSSGPNLSGKRLYIAIAAWLILIIAGGFCTWYGWFGGGSDNQRVGDNTAIPATSHTPTPGQAASAPTTAATAVPSTPTPQSDASAATPTTGGEEGEQEEDAFGYGIAANLIGGGAPNYWIGQVDSLGLSWVKQQVRWHDFSGAPGQMDWSGFDAVVDAANKKDIKVMFSVVDAPEWARSYTDENPEGAPPDNFAAFSDFLEQMVSRYKGRIHAIEVWNEQNLDREWDTAEGVNAERYVEMLRLAYQTIKAGDPNIIVVSGALSPVGSSRSEGDRVIYMDDFEYFDRMIQAGFLDYCDCVGAHHNGYNIPPDVATGDPYQDPDAVFRGFWDTPNNHEWSFKSTLWGYHDRIQAAGSNKPLCVTEFGWASSEGFESYPPGFEFAQDNTLQEQAEWDVKAFQLMREWGFVRLAFLWNLNYSQTGYGPEDPNAPYALIDFNGAGRPAFGAIGAMPKP